MIAAEQSVLVKQLESRLVELQHRLESIKKDVTQAHSDDFAEQAQERENDEVIDVIGNETRASIDDIKKTLQRIKDGSYGLCVSCGQAINPSRLEALPASLCCIKCAD